MKFLLLRNGCVALLALTLFAHPSTVNAQVGSEDLSNLGLELYWRAQINQGSNVGTPISVVLHPHSTLRKQSVTVMSNGRIVERISGNAVDAEEYERQITKIDSLEKAENTKIKLPRVGLEGAKKLASKIEKRLKLLGQQVEVMEPEDKEMIYLVVTSRDGVVQAFDAETGESLWHKEIGSTKLLMQPAGVSDDHVAVINGSDLHILRLSDGTLVNTRRLEGSNAVGSVPIGKWAFVPSMGGSMVAYNILDPKAQNWRATSGGNATEAPTISLDRKFLAWNSAPRFLNLVRVEASPENWNRFESSETVRHRATSAEGAFIVATADGGVARVMIPTSTQKSVRNAALAWRVSSGISNPETPVVANGFVYVWSAASGLMAIEESTGSLSWNAPVVGVSQVVAVSKDKVYCRTIDDRLIVLDGKTGGYEGALGENRGSRAKVVPMAISNRVNDRLLFVTESGSIVCIREKDAVVYSHQVGVPKAVKPFSNDPTEEKGAEAGEPSDPFGGGVPAAEPAMPAGDDPFGGAGGDPFGAPAGGMEEGKKTPPSDPNDPFGSF